MDAIRATIGTTVRMVAVLAFLIGMPLWALSGARLNFRILDAPPPVAIPGPGPVSGGGLGDDSSADNSVVQRLPDGVGQGTTIVAGEADGLAIPRDVAKETAARQPLHDASPPGLSDSSHQTAPRLREIQQQLVTMGADAMLLEVQDTAPASYRFWCQMPIPTSRTYGRRFEAVAADPVSAMRKVLAKVDAWQMSASRAGQQ